MIYNNRSSLMSFIQ